MVNKSTNEIKLNHKNGKLIQKKVVQEENKKENKQNKQKDGRIKFNHTKITLNINGLNT